MPVQWLSSVCGVLKTTQTTHDDDDDDDDDRLYFNRVHNYSQDCSLPYGPAKLNYNISSYRHLNYLLKEQLIHSMYQSKQTGKNGIRRKTGLYVLRASLKVNSEVK